MFSKLSRRFTLTLSFSVLAFLLFFFIFSGFYTIRLVKNDISQKASQMHKQYAKSIEFKLAGLENLCAFTIQSDEMHNALLSKDNSYISNQLYIVQNSSDNILGLCIADKYGNIYASTSNYTALPYLIYGDNYMKYLKDNIFLKNWFIADVTNTPSDEVMANNPLVFLLPIRIDSKIEGYLFLHCSLKQLIKDLEYEDNIFLSGSSMILSDDSSYALLMENKRSSSEVYSKIPFENYKNLSLIYYSPKIILTGDLAFIGLIFGIIFLLFLIFGFWWIKTYIKSIILPLENLSDSMRKYIEIQKNKMF